jgi:hypothetical protein
MKDAGGALVLAAALSLLIATARAHKSTRWLFIAAVVGLAASTAVHLAGLWSLVDRTPWGFEWEVFLPLDLICALASVLWVRSAGRHGGWARRVRLIAAWVTTALPVVAHALGDRHRGVAGVASIAVFVVLTILSAHAIWARRGGRQLVAAAMVFGTGIAASWLPIWTTVTGARSYRMDASGTSAGETCDFALGRTSAWFVEVPRDSVCPTGDYLPWVYGLNALLTGALVAAFAIGGRKLLSGASPVAEAREAE